MNYLSMFMMTNLHRFKSVTLMIAGCSSFNTGRAATINDGLDWHLKTVALTIKKTRGNGLLRFSWLIVTTTVKNNNLEV